LIETTQERQILEYCKWKTLAKRLLKLKLTKIQKNPFYIQKGKKNLNDSRISRRLKRYQKN
jgi:hypothetical protein